MMTELESHETICESLRGIATGRIALRVNNGIAVPKMLLVRSAEIICGLVEERDNFAAEAERLRAALAEHRT